MSSDSGKEIEARWINLDPAEMRVRLEKAGATQVGSYLFQEWIFAHPEWRSANRRVRVRSDGTTTWITYKANSTGWTIDGTEEIEFEASSVTDAVALVRALSIPQLRHQEKKRETWQLGNITFDLDFWPSIPMVFEIEAPSEARVREGAKLVGLSWGDAIFEDQAYVHINKYGIDIFALTEYCFPK